jgi:hypothetical protein
MKHRLDSFDFIFLSYDEPNAEILYSHATNLIPWVKRVHGVKGFDSAHLACADSSDTDFFVTIDGDNEIYPNFLDIDIDIKENHADHAWTWAGRNSVNGLVYGNGGLKLWSKAFVKSMKSHENAEDPRKAVEFCWDNKYHEVQGCYSTSHINASEYQAWRSGFREGVKMCLERGAVVSIADFHKKIWYGNINRLCIWCSIGSDVENGLWAMYGARLGVYHTMIENNDHTAISNYETMQDLWKSVKDNDPATECARLEPILKSKIGLDICMMRPDESKFFKRVYMNPPRPWIANEMIDHFMAVKHV